MSNALDWLTRQTERVQSRRATAMQPGNRRHGDPANRGSRSDKEGSGPGGEAADGHGGEAVGGLGRPEGQAGVRPSEH